MLARSDASHSRGVYPQAFVLGESGGNLVPYPRVVPAQMGPLYLAYGAPPVGLGDDALRWVVQALGVYARLPLLSVVK